jgi:peptide/nickel transport system permease protein
LTSSTISLTRESVWREDFNQIFVSLRRNPIVILGLMVIALWIVLAMLAPQIAPYERLKQDVNIRLQAPDAIHAFGTDELGRDMLSRVLWGAQITIPAGVLVIIFGSVVGIIVGAVAGFAGGLWDELLMRITELFMAFPTIILALAITAALGADTRNAIVALAVVWWPTYARLVRGLVLEVKSKEYVEGTRSVGATGFYVLFKTVLPNCISPAIVLASLDIGNAILTFAGLSFLGLGPEPSSPEWGRMVSTGIDYFDQWWMWLYPGMAIAILVMAFNFVGDGLRDLLDPRLRK